MKKILSMFLALCMVLTMVPVSAMAEETHTTIGGGGEIISFAPLEETEKVVSLGTSIEDLELPETLTAVVRTASITDSSASEEIEIDIPVIWTSPEYDKETEGIYVFSPIIEGYTVSAELPQITVTVGQLAVEVEGSKAVMLAEENVNIEEIKITDANASKIQKLFDDKGSGIAEVTDNNGTIKIKLLKNITGIIIIYTSNSNYILDANEKTLSGGGQPEAIQIANSCSGSTLELVGNGIYKKGGNNSLYISDGNTLIIKSATIYGNIFNYNIIRFEREEGSDYFTVKNNGIDLFEEKNKTTQTTYWIYVTGTGLVVAQHGLDLAGTAIISNESPRIGEVLNGSLVGNNNTGTLSYVWKAAGTIVGTEPSYTVTESDLGKPITLEISSSVETGTITSTATAEVLKKVAPSAPEAPTLVSKTHNNVTLTANASYEFSKDGTTWQTDNVFSSLTESTTYTFYQRVAETSDTEKSASSTGLSVTTSLAPAGALTGTAIISNESPRIGEVLNGSLVGGNNTGTLSYVWKVAGAQVGTEPSYTVTESDLGKTITLEISSSVETGTITSTATAKVLKKVAPSAPEAPTLVSKTHNNVTLTANASYEFSKDGTTWQTDNVFSSLTESTTYTFYQRVAETSDTESSVSSTGLSVKTNSNGGGSGSSGGSSSNDNSSSVIVTLPTPDKPNSPIQGEIKVPGTVDSKGNVMVSITDKTVTDAFDKALADAKKNGTERNGITVVLRVDTGIKAGSSVTVNLPKNVQDTIIAKKIVNTIVVVDNPNIRVGMDLATVREINSQAKSDMNITANRVDSGKLTGEAKRAIGSRPVFDLKVNYGNDKQVQNFGAGSVSVTIPYTLGANEKARNVQAVYVDENGKVHWLVNSVYDSVEKVLRFSTDHFSTYGIGYKQADTVFTDIANHWAKDDIEFVVSRGLFSGTSATIFSPNTAMTRGMFVTVLGRLANADVSGYKKSNFTDVKSDAYYMGYIEWARKNSIINGTGNGTFAPDQSITREQMAVIIQNYAKVIGFTMPKVYGENTFADSTKISVYAKDAVKQIQMAGVISGKHGNLFDPQGTATRAEVSAVMGRLVELVISSDTMQGVTADVPKNLKYTTYTVQKGDSFWLIAHTLGCTLTELERLNNKSRFALIHQGDMLRVPEK
ncbi:Ig-like domain (group 4) [Desulfonispora thiosulfatigenes DSM 11270]|uniref:Ig-like domain (Group 4) n=1 Tax=Desulfonispora thiosulfatigenes DSM 11270 TaxID=656914 RepID=A0A1W1V9F5_DESTI|nr:S-layer homology domain-containing protein [Desulfonispora thiosulfatigenes]SMB89903.1 Ig-like domain (group 4) [Desulfonispora thiosulfatigenes DSM 11270]